jgi:hypothetical protein
MAGEEQTLGKVAAETRDLLKDVLIALGGEVPGQNAEAWDHNHCTVATPASPKQLPPFAVLAGYKLVVCAMPTNTGKVYIGESRDKALNVSKRVTLQPHEATALQINNANLVWLDVVVAGEGIEYWSEVRK